jgi:hypothetical protein
MLASHGPQIDRISPMLVETGDVVEIRGARLASEEPLEVFIGTKAQPEILQADASTIRFRIARDSTPGKVEVRNAHGSAVSVGIVDIVRANVVGADSYTFGNLNGSSKASVYPVGTEQPVLVALARTRWATPTGIFSDFSPTVDASLSFMNDFWNEASFGKVSFESTYAGDQIYRLPRSKYFYYRRKARRRLMSTGWSSPVEIEQPVSLVIASDGVDVTVDIPPGMHTIQQVRDMVSAAIANVPSEQTAPTFSVNVTLNRLKFESTVPSKLEGKLTISGAALPHLRLGEWSLHESGDFGPFRRVYGQPLNKGFVFFPANQELVIESLGASTVVNFPQGELTLEQVEERINVAMNSSALQQPFGVSTIDNPLNADEAFLVFSTEVDPVYQDHGYRLAVDGSAAQSLGLAEPGVTRRFRTEYFRSSSLLTDSFVAYSNESSELPATQLANSSMLIVVLVDDDNLRPNFGARNLTVGGEQYEVDTFVTRTYSSQSRQDSFFAHEAGHSLYLPDLYPVKGWELGTSPGRWDIMADARDAHPVSWLKSFHHIAEATSSASWIQDEHILRLTPPDAGETLQRTVIVSPLQSPWPSENAFAAQHPFVNVVHGVEIVPTDPSSVIWIENRQRGPYHADHLGEMVSFSTTPSTEGLVAYEALRPLIARSLGVLPVSIIPPTRSLPLNTPGDELQYPFSNENRVSVTVLEKLLNPDETTGPQSFSYLVGIEWGAGSFYDLAIRPWAPPPWETPDIWIDNTAENGWDSYAFEDEDGNAILNGDRLALGRENRLYARVHNFGDVDVTEDVTVIWRVALPQVTNQIEKGPELGRVVISGGIPAQSSVVTPPLDFRPAGADFGHICVSAEIQSIAGERNETSNNSAQENITQWFSNDGSPYKSVVFPVETRNPFEDQWLQVRMNVPDVPLGWAVTVQDHEFELAPSEAKRQLVEIKPLKELLVRENPRGSISAFMANIEALIPWGDEWVELGGVTAAVYPVNNISRLDLSRAPVVNPQGNVEYSATLFTSGAQIVDMQGRAINLRLGGDTENAVWIKGRTDETGRALFVMPEDVLGREMKVKAFYSGGVGIGPVQSPERAIDIPAG